MSTRRVRRAHLLVRVVASLVLLWAAAPTSVHADLPKRELPDYDGRPEETTAGDVLLWIPRVILSPLYLVSEYVVRRPLGFLVSEAERLQLPEFLYDLFLFGPDHSAGLLPIAFLDFGFYPSVGLYFFYNDFIPHQDLQVRGSTWGEHWLAGSVSDRIHIDRVTDLVIAGSGTRRPDFQFFGIGPDTVRADRSRYGASRLDGTMRLELQLGGLSRLSTGIGVRRVHFHRGGFDDDPTLEQAVRDGRYPLPAGHERGYTLLYNHLSLTIDTRQARPASGTGVRMEARVEQDSQLAPSANAGFLHYGASVGGFFDLGDRGRIVSLSFATQFVDPLRNDVEIPFTELASIGGGESMRGFPMGRLYGRSSAVATLRYRWPVWIWLDGSIQLAVGNVFNEHLDGFSPKRLRLSAAIGIESVGSPDSSIELLFGVGSETFEHGTQITSLRLIVGSNHGF
ncbi:MAG: BamA/TamA family outer membrane protein [Polyangiales bacterium]